ncbi:unnamed protein product [Clonostachys byssicola]|uniref:1-alkyl-2-acetylglycerophosphocholine esterase n=1 Tax=Clonostachys byssicola TaxID=160290 RepID=A0A9N9U5Y6_9HYPO|nr:unnamed protein product [Clonostachys byssicola]
MKLHSALCLAVWLAQCCNAEPIPEPPGPYNVGVRRLVINFDNPDDPVSPNNISTEYLATIYYPTEDSPSAPATYIEPELAQMYADVYKFNISHLTSTNHWNASYLSKCAGPSLVFAPGGWGPSTDGFVILLSDLASRGYVVAALDHPYEQPFLRFPNGTGLVGLPITTPSSQPLIDLLHAVRVREMLHFVRNWPKLVTELGAPFRKTRIGAFGHSFGGSSALSAGIESDAIVATLNQDGTIWGRAAHNDSSADAGKPTMLLTVQGHNNDQDKSFQNYTSNQSGWWRVISVNGTVHADWTDATFWKRWGTTRPMGTIDGRRMADIRGTYVSAFFGEHIGGQESPLLDKNSEEWPEVTVYDGNDI